MIKAIALDDEPPALVIVRNFCSRIEDLELEKAFTKTEEALKYLSKFPVDLLFLDINMPSISGLEFSKKILPHTMVIFITAHSQYAVEGFNLNAVDYLLKPFTFDRFVQAINKAKAYHTARHKSETPATDHILLRGDYALIKVQFDAILYVEGLGDYIKIHQKNQKPLVIRITMKALNEKLPAVQFIRVHRSFIVSLRHIESVRNKMILIGEHEIPVGALYEDDFFKKLQELS